MAKKITELTELTSYATNDLLIIEDVSTSTTKKITWANLIADASITAAKLVDASVTSAKLSGINKSLLTTDSNPYKFSVYRNAAWTSANGSFGKVQFDTEEYDTNNNFDNATNYRYTAPVAGFYQFNSSVMAAAASGSGLMIALYKNGAEVKRGTGIVTGAATFNTNIVISTLLQLAATDYVEIFFYGSGGTGQTGPVVSYFNGYLVSRT